MTPAAGESVTEGTILEWHVRVGDPIDADDTIVEISTDKVDVELPSPASGTVSEILVQEGDTVTVGQVIARIAVGEGNGAVPAATNGDGASAADGAQEPEPEPEAEAQAPTANTNGSGNGAGGGGGAPAAPDGDATGDDPASGRLVDVVTPAAGESVSEGTILEWRARVGDFIAADDTIVEISTDKVDVELPSPASGTVSELLAQEGDTVTVGQVIARILVGDAEAMPTSLPGESAPPPAPVPQPATSTTVDGASADGAIAAVPQGTKASPVAARVAAAEGVNLANVSGTGPGGRIVKSDVLDAARAADASNGSANAAATATATAPPAAGNEAAGAVASPETAATRPAGAQQLKGGAAALARYMEQSREIPTATSFRTLAVTVLDARRRELKAAGKRVSYTHLIAWAIARAAQDMPVMSTHYAAIDGRANRIDDGQVNLGLAVDVQKKDGTRTLMVPVIPNAGNMRFDRFLAAYDALVEKARTNTLTAD
ncbi:MAG TPA: biotin/lipoyl-containing protein, partial [Acidimicrobiales bacterium]|nr:biotin/lipoyl-containing protein [Acidimicrobiales bacterium]